MSMDETYAVTVYNGSTLCPKCGAILGPTEALFAGPTGLCTNCRNILYAKQAKSAMSIQ
mgnify:FL=1